MMISNQVTEEGYGLIFWDGLGIEFWGCKLSVYGLVRNSTGSGANSCWCWKRDGTACKGKTRIRK